MMALRGFLDTLPEHEVLRLADPVELDYRPTALVLELERRGRTPVLWIERPTDGQVPVVANLFADRGRIARMAGTTREGFNDSWLAALERPIPAELVPHGAVQEVVEQGPGMDADRLPISRHFAQDAGRYIGSGYLICRDPDTGVRNLSFQRLQLKGPDRFGVSLHSRGHIWEHWQRARARGRNLEVAVVIGGHPAIHLAAGAKMGMDLDELAVAGALLGRPVPLVQCRSIDVQVPAEAEYVLEGEILADVFEDEGPYGEYTGYSTSRSTRNVFVVRAITHRAAPIWHDIIPGYSAEHLLLGRSGKEAHVFARLREMVPNLVALNFPKSGTHFHAYLSFRKRADGEARHALMLLFGLDPYLKLAIAVDEDVDVFDEQEVLWALATRFQADRDMFVVPDVFCNRLDPSAVNGVSAKMGLDATKPLEWDVERTSLPEEAIKWAKKMAEG
jgi:2,5-furandicarboxylate decarboxylase 1